MLPRCVHCAGVAVLIVTAPLTAGEKQSDRPMVALSTAAPVRLGNARFANVGRVFALAYSPDGRLVAGGAWDGSIRVWEAATAKELHCLAEQKGPIRKLAFSHDARCLASAGKAPGLCLWDLHTGKLDKVLGSAKDEVSDLAFSPDDKQVAAVAHGTLHVWDRAGKPVWRQGDDRIHARLDFRAPDAISSLYIKPVAKFEKQLYPGENSQVFLSNWALPTGKELDTRALGPFNPMGSPILGPGGLVVQRIAFRNGPREQITYFRAGRSEAVRKIDLADQNVSAMCVAPDGRMLAISVDAWGAGSDRGPKFIRVFEIATGLERCRFESLDQGQLSLAFSPDGRRLATGSLDVTVLVWDLTHGEANPKQPLTEADLARLLSDLKGSDAALAYRSHWKLVAAGKHAVPFIARHVHPVVAADPKRVAALIHDLADERFDTRQGAHAELRKLEDRAEPALRTALAGSETLEARRRIEDLLKQIDQLSPERLAYLRAIEALEHMHTPNAEALLRDLAAGAPAASATAAAAEALGRLRRAD
jgi:hypothetical protein